MTPLIYYNPQCGTSRNVLAMMEAAGEAPQIVDYLAAPPSRAKLIDLLAAMQITADELLRRKEPIHDELRLDDPQIDDNQLIDAMITHPILINRPIVVTDKGVRLCRPSQRVFDLLNDPPAQFTKEDGETVYFPETSR
ncbi:MAG: arsenate reductase (glutaredoxin) [Salinisphaera sp.]|jgi:arsenate reductase|nr:arsenate reductase (glutaredoxin) [Salinisphaera sp.]